MVVNETHPAADSILGFGLATPQQIAQGDLFLVLCDPPFGFRFSREARYSRTQCPGIITSTPNVMSSWRTVL
jgi:hypothetical protein